MSNESLSELDLDKRELNKENSSKSEGIDHSDLEDLRIRPGKVDMPRIDRKNQVSFVKDVTKPLNPDLIYQCVLKREKRGLFGSYVYQLFSEGDEEPILIATTDSSIFSTKFTIIETVTGNKIGLIESNMTSLIYDVNGHDSSFVIEYEENFLGRHGARTFRLIFNEDKVYISKPPVFINGEYYQDLHNIDALPSIKNFICVSKFDFAKEVCILARTESDSFILQIQNPFSIFIAFSLSLTSLHTGLLHR